MRALVLMLCLLSPAWLMAAVVSEEIRYTDGETVMHGYLAYQGEADQQSWQAMQAFCRAYLLNR